MESFVSLKAVVFLLGMILFWMFLLWGFTYYIMLKSVNTIYNMISILAKGMCDHHDNLVSNQKEILLNISKQNAILEKLIKQDVSI